MPIFNYKAKEMIVKIVYYGPGLCGKTTSLQFLHTQTIQERKGELYFLATETDHTIYFELLPMYVGEIKQFKLRFQVYTVPGQVKYNNTRKAVLQGVDAIVFVADSQYSRREANVVSFKNLHYNLKEAYNIRLKDVPLVFEYNKRDMKNILSVSELNRELNPWDAPYFETIATTGEGVLEAFERISALAISKLERQLLHSEVRESPTAFKGLQKRIFHSLNLRSAESESVPTNNSPSSPSTDDTSPISSAAILSDLEDEANASDALSLLNEQAEEEFTENEQVFLLPEEPPEEKHPSYLDILAATYHDGEVIFEEGDPGDEMYFIEEGKVKIVGRYKTIEKELIVYSKGDFFGEMILFGGKTRSAKAIAVGMTRLIPVTRETLASQIQSKPEIAIALLETLYNRIRNSTRTIGQLASQNKELILRLRKTQNAAAQVIKENKKLKQQVDRMTSTTP